MIDARQLLLDLQSLRQQLEDDLRKRSENVSELRDRLKDEWQRAKANARTAQAYEAWRDDYLAQAAVMWLLSCVFVRFLEDNDLVAPPRLSAPGDRLRLARDQHTLYFQQHPLESDRDYLYFVFDKVAAQAGAGSLFDHRHNPVWSAGISGDAATAVIDFWQRIEPSTGALVHDFTDPDWGTRFLGDLYQDLSESARKKYALLQTPDFVLQFILDRTLAPAIGEFGEREVRLIDPACGSGHFLLAAFERIFRLRSRNEPGENPRVLAQRTLEQVAGVDLNPFAAAIARFRLLLAALKVCGITRLADAPAFAIHVAAGDSLLHGPRPGLEGARQMYLDGEADPIRHVYASEDADDLRRILGRRYHVVVGNPPYITPKDAALNQAYREIFGSCHMKYSLAVPFMERLFDLTIAPEPKETAPAGYVGMITANSFMKREFGSKLIEQFIPRWDLTHVIDTSGAYIPGHGTPTVILFGRHREPTEKTIRAVLGIRGEPSTPEDPSKGLVWSAILQQVDHPGSTGLFVSVTDANRKAFERHPWSIGGGGAAELKDQIESAGSLTLGDLVESIGFASFPGTDEVFTADAAHFVRSGVPAELVRQFVVGEVVRDWSSEADEHAFVPYDGSQQPIALEPEARWARRMWPYRTTIGNTISFGGRTLFQNGDEWWTWYRWIASKYRTPLSIAFAEVATHNHFVLDRGGKVFKQTAPVIKLKPEATEDDHLALLAVLNSSTACFWMKQVSHQKQMMGGDGIRVPEKSKVPYQFSGTRLGELPLPNVADQSLRERSSRLARELDSRAALLHEHRAAVALSAAVPGGPDAVHGKWESFRRVRESALGEMVVLQEELDWLAYEAYAIAPGLTAQCDVLRSWKAQPGERPFEILAGGNQDGFTVPAAIPGHWPPEMSRLWALRIETIRSNAELRLIEDPHYKRRWIGRQGLFNHAARVDEFESACREWLLDRLEQQAIWQRLTLISIAQLADRLRSDRQFMTVASVYRDTETFNVSALVAELIESEAVPFLPALRYKPSGLRKREAWERNWDLQRQEDAIDARTKLPDGHPARLSEDRAAKMKVNTVGEIPVPPKYRSTDFASGTYWRLRGKLDVPKERFISYPHCEREADPTMVIAWAGWDHLQQAQALATYYVQMKESEGWQAQRLTPILAGLLELVPWLKQWHNELDPRYGQRMGDYYEGFLSEELRSLKVTEATLAAWRPPNRVRVRKRP
jgi:hypothetical protein